MRDAVANHEIHRRDPRGAPVSAHAEALLAALEARTAEIGVVGLGYVGLPLVGTIGEAGFKVVGFDIDSAKIEALHAGRRYIAHIDPAALTGLIEDGRFTATADVARLARADAILICVPTPLTRQREPDLSYVEATVRSLAPHLRPGQLLVLESTTYPGTTRDVIRPIVEATGLRSGVDVFLAYSPEREDPGNPDFGTSRIPKVVGGDGPEALRLARALYDRLVVRTVPVGSCETAEAVKLFENIFRSVNIALVNELKLVYGAMGIDVFEVIEAAKTKPFGYMPFYPGPGLGGHCIPIDPFYLTWKAREYGIATRFIELAGEINTAMPLHVVHRTAEALDARFRKGLNGSRILLVGIAYKKNVDDPRESPGLHIWDLLAARCAEVLYHDPHIEEILPSREYGHLAGRRSVALDPDLLGGIDAALIVTDHDAVDWCLLGEHAPLVVDTRNVMRDAPRPERVVRA
jgi:UDP-N-acetyl-D-glucosamine dehydrogenase